MLFKNRLTFFPLKMYLETPNLIILIHSLTKRDRLGIVYSVAFIYIKVCIHEY